MLAYTAGKLALAATGTAYDAATTIYHELQNGASTWDAFIKPLRECTEQWNMQDLRAADVAYYAARFTADVAASHKLQSGMQRVYSTACRNARAFRNAHLAAQVEDYLLTADGQLTMSLMDGASDNQLFCKVKQTPPKGYSALTKPSKYLDRKIQHIVACEQTLADFGAKKSGEVIRIPTSRCTNMILTADEKGIKHTFALEYTELTKADQSIEKRIGGFHHDPSAKLENMGTVKLLNKKVHPEKSGCSKAVLHYNGLEKEKTFFPSDWTYEQVWETMLESLNNDSRIIEETPARIIIKATTKHNFTIKTVFDENGRLITTYPLLET